MKPIIFSTPMVRAILDERKTQTRRVIKCDQPDTIRPRWDGIGPSGWHDGHRPMRGPRYHSGDVLWVRETWCNVNKPEYTPEFCYFADTRHVEDYDPTEWKWHPSIHMSREAARLFLRVTDVRAERLQEIVTEDICKEGIWVDPPPIVSKGVRFPNNFEKRPEAEREDWISTTARATYIGQCEHIAALHREWEKLWDSLNAKRGYPWESNPWVWVYSFERISKEEAEHG